MSPLIRNEVGGLRVTRGDLVIAIPVFGAHERFVECVRSVLAHTPVDVPLLVIDDASPDDRSVQFLVDLDRTDTLRHTLHYVRNSQNLGFVASVNAAFDCCSPADVIVLNSDCVVTANWTEAMRAAGDGPLVATVSVFTNNGTILSLPERNLPLSDLPQTLALDTVADAIRSASSHTRPRLPTAVGHCFLVKRVALDLVGPFDEAFSPGYGEEVDFSQRCVRRGLVHVLADEVFVLHKGSASFSSSDGSAIKEAHDRVISVRYPYYDRWVADVATSNVGPFAYAIKTANRALRELTVTIDARTLGPVVTGTQIHTLELIGALARTDGVSVRAVVPPALGDYARAVLARLEGIDVVPVEAVRDGNARTDVAHRPLQVASREDLALLEAMGERIVITQQDLIAFHNPGYFPTYDAWKEYRGLARYALAHADRVVFFSRSARNEAIAERLVDPIKADPVYIGTVHLLDTIPAHERAPVGVERLMGRPYVLCLGTDFAHKNRVFALQVLDALRRDHGYAGGLVLAGPHVPIGSSAADEAEFLALNPSLQDHVVDVAAVGEGEKRWLLRNAELMLYSTVHEGFGLLPFECAEMELVCAFASHTSIAELLPRKLALIEQWDAEATARNLSEMMASPGRRAEHIAAVKAAGARLTWRSTAGRLVAVYRSTIDDDSGVERRLAREALFREMERLKSVEQSYLDLCATYDSIAAGLVGPNGAIPPDLRRPLLAIGHRRMLRDLIFGAIRGVYVAGYWARHGRRPPRLDGDEASGDAVSPVSP